MEKLEADAYQRVQLYDGKREHDIAFRGRRIGSSQKAAAHSGWFRSTIVRGFSMGNIARFLAAFVGMCGLALCNSARSIRRITTSGNSTEYTYLGSYEPKCITAGPDHSMWFLDGSSVLSVEPGSIERKDRGNALHRMVAPHSPGYASGRYATPSVISS